MELILLERIEKLGAMGDVVNVKPGFARNYLLPQEKALRATKANLARFEAEREILNSAMKKTAKKRPMTVKPLMGQMLSSFGKPAIQVSFMGLSQHAILPKTLLIKV